MKTHKLSETTYLFDFEKNISTGDFSITSAQQATSSPLAKKLFGFPWTESLDFKKTSLALTKKDWVDWDILLDPLQDLLTEHAEQMTSLEEPPKSQFQLDGSTETEQIKKFIEESINPSLAMHGGWVELKSFENQMAYLSLGGGCQGCASSQATMLNGIETALKENFSFVQRVLDVTDHAAGENPYY